MIAINQPTNQASIIIGTTTLEAASTSSMVNGHTAYRTYIRSSLLPSPPILPPPSLLMMDYNDIVIIIPSLPPYDGLQ
jgi:hypothetical protein